MKKEFCDECGEQLKIDNEKDSGEGIKLEIAIYTNVYNEWDRAKYPYDKTVVCSFKCARKYLRDNEKEIINFA